ncbi:histone deacetylase family protein [Oceanomicrobium pacificus]|uniref:Histone deacetylase family protein n=1 Tax=Oceanomicrobium pacificus TaxID=2692916 RepID=A0A6B0TKG2_9RHOB|nr:histone deacetylase family protein [Oceanomicrobium pacificus]MXU64957.1 histone deacetylase family protein [Oceanomicrobium pacificus]
MTTALYTHPSALDHLTPDGHPERVARMDAILTALDAPEFAALDRQEAPAASDADLLLAHPQSHIDAVRAAAPAQGSVALDPDTHMSPGSLDAALHAVGGCIAAVDRVLAGDAGNAFVAMRPPGHHAERTRAMGFCLFGTVAIAAKHALERHGLDRVAIVDFDVHHGNGTQDLLWDEPRIRFASTHQMPLYPGSGRADERGAHGQILNVPLAPGSDGADLHRAMDRQILPMLDAFKPELVLVSAGFDAHARDPLANLNWQDADFARVTADLCRLAATHAGGRLVSTLEGGYDLEGLASGMAAHVATLMEHGQ